ncbi:MULTISPECIES: hypothetical protein [unclassified Carboxylicivirga]|uniref:hypothetical protein n=1 Tax=Carboxylicivirga TaxID=1628153 RepID=UPI003D3312D0
MKILNLTLLFIFTSLCLTKAQDKAEKDYKVVYSQSFSKSKSCDDFHFSDTPKWLISKNGKSGKSLKCLGSGDYKAPHEGPSVMAILKNIKLEDFIVEMDVVQNGKDFNLLDFCIFFGMQDTAHYAFAQIAGHADKDTHNVFVMDGDKRRRIGEVNDKGVIWRLNEWQNIRMECMASENSVKVYFDDELVMESRGEAFRSGFIGFGSTSSALKVDNFKVSAPAFETEEASIFQ